MVLSAKMGLPHTLACVVSCALSVSGIRGDRLEGFDSEQKIVFKVGCGLILASEVLLRLEGLNTQTRVKTSKAYIHIWVGECRSPSYP